MERREYFGRPKFLNMLATRGIFGLARLRLAALRAKNTYVARMPEPHPPSRDPGEAWRAFRDQGFDKLNVGGGRKNLEGFVNVDFVAHPGVLRELIADAADLSFIDKDSVSQVHTNHVLEHLAISGIVSFLSTSRRILKPGGLLTVRCPNMLGICYGFVFGPIFERDRARFVELGFPPDEAFGDPRDGWYYRDLFAMLHWMFGDAGNRENEHLSRLTPSLLTKLIEDAGFEVLASAEPEATNIVVVSRKPLA